MRFFILVVTFLTLIGTGKAQSPPDKDSTACRLNVLSYPDSALIFIDDVLCGHTPYISKDIVSGHHQVKLLKEGYVEYLDSVNIRTIEPASIYAKLRVPGALNIKTQPPGASIYLDGEFLGITPLDRGKLTPGRRNLKQTFPDYEDLENIVLIPEGDTAKVNSILSNKYGSLSLLVDSDNNEVFLDGVSMGLGSLKNLKVSTGTHSVEVRSRDSLGRIAQKIFIGSGSNINLNAKTGVTSVTPFILPGYAQFRDGSSVEGLALSIGTIAFGSAFVVSALKYSSDLNDYDVQRSDYLNAKSEKDALRAHEALTAPYSDLRNQRQRVFLFAGLFAAMICYNTIDVLINHKFKTSFFETSHVNVNEHISFGEKDVEWFTLSIKF